MKRNFRKLDVSCRATDEGGNELDIDPKAIRKATMAGQDTGLGSRVLLHAHKKVDTVEQAIETADSIIAAYYDRFGLEVECWNIGRTFGNFFILRDDNFDSFIGPRKLNDGRGLVLLTATLVCRRCRREMKGFYELSRDYPQLNFALVQLNSPQFKFYDRVFGDMGGGDPDSFRKNAAGVTPFIIIYKPDETGILQYAEYYGTEKDEFTPTPEDAQRLIKKHFGI
jgi:hypothetical protein